jgi:hypothetical protein
MGIVIIILAVKVQDADIYDSADEEIKRLGKSAFYLMIIFGCFALGASILGAVTAKWNRAPCLLCVSI